MSNSPLALARRFSLPALAAAALVAHAPAATVVLTPTKDTTLYGPTDKSNGSGAEFFAGRAGHGNILRALVAFDLSAIPAGVLIESAELALTITTPQGSHANTVDLHRLLADWGQGLSSAGSGGGGGALAMTGDATWNTRFFNTPGAAWATAGGDFASAVSAFDFVTGSSGTAGFSSPGLVADVQAWVNGTASNFGWILVAEDEVTTGAAIRFASREAATGKPMLAVSYSVTSVPEPGATAFFAGVGALLLVLWRRRLA